MGKINRKIQSRTVLNRFDRPGGSLLKRRAIRIGIPSIVLTRDPKNLSADPNFPDYFMAFASDVPQASPPTPDVLTPGRSFVRNVYAGLDIAMPGGQLIEVWGFEDPLVGPQFPSQAVRVVEGDIVHVSTTTSKGPHTIHWHGIEPTAMNDGVGKLSFELGEYTYQWYASAAGTYFYHCHHNTVLHFEMGMYGLVIIDPPVQGAPFATGGPGFCRRENAIVPYDVEAAWVFDDLDPRWHALGAENHDAGFPPPGLTLMPYDDPMNPKLDNFSPQYFIISGRPHPWSRNLPNDPQFPGVAATVRVGQTLLVRLLAGGYGLHKFVFDDLDAEVIATDGRVLGQDPYTKYSRPFTLSAGVPFELTTARRYDLLIKPTAAQIGSHLVVCQFLHHINLQPLGIAETFIHVIP